MLSCCADFERYRAAQVYLNSACSNKHEPWRVAFSALELHHGGLAVIHKCTVYDPKMPFDGLDTSVQCSQAGHLSRSADSTMEMQCVPAKITARL